MASLASVNVGRLTCGQGTQCLPLEKGMFGRYRLGEWNVSVEGLFASPELK